MRQSIFLLVTLLFIPPAFSQDEAEEKTYSEKLKDAYAEKLKKSKELYNKGVKVASEKDTETFEEGKN